jgi:hypothetical protein
MGIVVLAVFNSAEECGSTFAPVAEEEVVSKFAITEWGPTFVGDTVYLLIDATKNSAIATGFKSTWTQTNASIARLIDEKSGVLDPNADLCSEGGSGSDCAAFVITGVGATTVTATATVTRTPGGARPTASTTLVATAAPTRLRILPLPAQIRVGESLPIRAQFETSSGAVVTSQSLYADFEAPDANIALSLVQTDFRGVTPGLARIRAKAGSRIAARFGLTAASFTDEATILVVGPAARVVVSPVPVVLRVGETRELSVVATDAAGSAIQGPTITASSATPAQLSATVNINGTITLRALSTGGLPESTVRLTVIASEGGLTTPVTQTPPTFVDVRVLARVASVVLTPSAASKQVGEQQTFLPAITYVAGATGTPAPPIEYTSSDPSRVSINAQGVATALVNTGSTPVSITATVEGVRSNVATMAVGPQRIALTPASATVASGGTRTLSVQEFTPAGILIGTVPNAQIQYSSNAVGVATVGADGVVTCAAGAGGSAIITATVRNTTLTSTSSISCGQAAPRPTIIVVGKRVGSTLTATTSETVPQGAKVDLEAIVLDQNNAPIPDAPITWTSSNIGVARVLSTVPGTGSVTGVAPGTANVVASLNSDPTVKATVAITVTAPTSNVTRIEIEPRDVRITAPATQQYTVTYFNAAGARIASESGGSVEWISSNSAADINAASGLARGAAAGTATITARYLRNGVQVVQATTGLTVAASGTPGNYGSVEFSIGGVTTRELRVAHGYTAQIIVRTPFGTQVTSGVAPAPNVAPQLELTSPNPGVTIAPSEPPPGAPAGYYFSITVAPGATVGSTVQLRSTVTGASGTITLTIVP